MNAIYKGTISHTRFLPKKHTFEYKVHMLFIDLDEIKDAFPGAKVESDLDIDDEPPF